jgi:hypothetical protein
LRGASRFATARALPVPAFEAGLHFHDVRSWRNW